MKRRVFMVSVFGVALAFLAAGPASGDDKTKPFDDAEFVKKAASGGMLEVKLSENAQTRVTNPDVRQYAARLVRDHAKANNELKAAAQSASVPVPDVMSEKDQKVLDHFKDIKGENYDREFIDHMVKDHEEDIAAFRRASQEAKHAQIKTFAARTLPTLEEHLRIAKDLQTRVKK